MTQRIASKLRTVAALLCTVLLLGSLPGAAWAQPAPVPPSPSLSAPAASPKPSTDLASPGTEAVEIAGQASPDLSPWGMFLNADRIVKAVMIGLAFASLVTWTVALAKGLELIIAKSRLRAAVAVLANADSLAEASQQLHERDRVSELVRAAITELRMSADTADKEGVKERVASRLERIEAAVGRAMVRGTGPLATIGATAPFVGLFGTVWGIMNSFIGISYKHTTNLAVVAPGIAEALLATALGLVAAVPAVVIYNMFSRSIAGYRALFADGAAEVMRLVSRDLDRAESQPTPVARRRAPLPAAE
ncbi:MAG: tonB-system energizer ExbB [Xanthobacteraceae bacterium]